MIKAWLINQETIECKRYNCPAIVRTVIYPNQKTYREVKCGKNCEKCEHGRTDRMMIGEILKELEKMPDL